jgi:DNA-binding response OmpR family regulator
MKPQQAGEQAVRLLLVEDDRETSAFVTRALEERGYDVETSFSGTDGLARAEAND